jgi:hypothetical protein
VNEEILYEPELQLGIMEEPDGTWRPVIRMAPCANAEEAEAVLHKWAPVFERVLGGNFQRVQ